MRFKRFLSGVTVAALLAGVLTGCGGSDPSASGSEGNDTVKMLAAITGGKDDEEMKLFAEALSEATGLKVEIEKPASDYDNVLMQKLQGGEEYDLVYCSTSQVMQLAEQGALMDITDKVEQSEILTNNIDPQEWEDIKIDGKIYAGFNKKELHRVVQLNKNHLEAAGIDYKSIEPTLDGYYEVFKALRAANSDPDYYPLNVVMSENYDLQPWFAPFLRVRQAVQVYLREKVRQGD